MGLFGKTVVVNGGLTRAVAEVIEKMAEAVAERLRGHDAEIAELRAEIERLKAEPRMTVAQRAKQRSKA